ncbi:phospholipase D-like domain-containing protein [Paenibacillus periandrae]|uniref:phospholipase D-like domain-containing protein n=1 Tax=Paenibacillus periandrae TaxID=1761741 RepID=UPI001F09DA00
MTTNVYFSRPGNDSEVYERIKLDIKYAKNRIYISQNYLSEEELRNLVFQKKNTHILVILDLTAAYGKTSGKINPTKKGELRDHSNVVYLGDGIKSHFHHKFVIIDNVVWLGSMNFSGNAPTNNWENMIRTDDLRVLSEYLSEFKKLFILGKALNLKVINANKCVCGKDHSKPEDDYNDPFDHMQINFIDTKIEIWEYEKNKDNLPVYELVTIEDDTLFSGTQDLILNRLTIQNFNELLGNAICKDQMHPVKYNIETRCEICNSRINNKTICSYGEVSSKY